MLDSPVYPHVIPYPRAGAEMTRPVEAEDEVTTPVRVKLPPQYPVLDICMSSKYVVII